MRECLEPYGDLNSVILIGIWGESSPNPVCQEHFPEESVKWSPQVSPGPGAHPGIGWDCNMDHQGRGSALAVLCWALGLAWCVGGGRTSLVDVAKKHLLTSCCPVSKATEVPVPFQQH